MTIFKVNYDARKGRKNIFNSFTYIKSLISSYNLHTNSTMIKVKIIFQIEPALELSI